MLKRSVLSMLVASFAIGSLSTASFAKEYVCFQEANGELEPHSLVISASENGSTVSYDQIALQENKTGFKKTCDGYYDLGALLDSKRFTGQLPTSSDGVLSKCVTAIDLLISDNLFTGGSGGIQFVEEQGISDEIPCLPTN